LNLDPPYLSFQVSSIKNASPPVPALLKNNRPYMKAVFDVDRTINDVFRAAAA
jgi:hypothetical protein